MKYLIFLALVVQAFAGPTTKPGVPQVPKTSHPPSTGNVHPLVSRLPQHGIASRPPCPGGQLVTKKDTEILRPAPPKMTNPPSTNAPRPAGGSSTPGKPPALGISQGKTGQDTKTSHPPSTGNVHRLVSRLPPHGIASRPPCPGGQLVTQKVTEILRPAPPKLTNPPSTNGPRPCGGSSTHGKPPAVGTSQGQTGQDTKSRSKWHLKDSGSHPTGAPHQDHTLHGDQHLFHVTKLRSKRHMKGSDVHPTGAPHQSHTPHTHQSEASHPPKVTHPANVTPQKHGQGKEPQQSHWK